MTLFETFKPFNATNTKEVKRLIDLLQRQMETTKDAEKRMEYLEELHHLQDMMDTIDNDAFISNMKYLGEKTVAEQRFIFGLLSDLREFTAEQFPHIRLTDYEFLQIAIILYRRHKTMFFKTDLPARISREKMNTAHRKGKKKKPIIKELIQNHMTEIDHLYKNQNMSFPQIRLYLLGLPDFKKVSKKEMHRATIAREYREWQKKNRQ